MAMCRAALESPRKSIIFEPYPSVVDPNDPKTLAFNPKVSAGGARAQWGWEAMATPLMVTSLLPHVEEELRAAAEGSGQRDVHPGDDPGIPGGLHTRTLCQGWHFGANRHPPTVGWVPGDPPAPPLASARAPTWRSRSRWTSWTLWPIPSCSGKAKGAAATSLCPVSPCPALPVQPVWPLLVPHGVSGPCTSCGAGFGAAPGLGPFPGDQETTVCDLPPLLFLFPRIISSNRSHIVKLPLSRVRGLVQPQVGQSMWNVGWRLREARRSV